MQWCAGVDEGDGKGQHPPVKSLGRARPTSKEQARGDGGGDPFLPRGPIVSVGLSFLSDPYLVPGAAGAWARAAAHGTPGRQQDSS